PLRALPDRAVEPPGAVMSRGKAKTSLKPLEEAARRIGEEGARRFARWDAALFQDLVSGPATRLWRSLHDRAGAPAVVAAVPPPRGGGDRARLRGPRRLRGDGHGGPGGAQPDRAGLAVDDPRGRPRRAGGGGRRADGGGVEPRGGAARAGELAEPLRGRHPA